MDRCCCPAATLLGHPALDDPLTFLERRPRKFARPPVGKAVYLCHCEAGLQAKYDLPLSPCPPPLANDVFGKILPFCVPVLSWGVARPWVCLQQFWFTAGRWERLVRARRRTVRIKICDAAASKPEVSEKKKTWSLPTHFYIRTQGEVSMESERDQNNKGASVSRRRGKTSLAPPSRLGWVEGARVEVG